MAYEKVTEVLTDGQYTVTLYQNKSGQFRVQYGLEVKSNLSYFDASREFGKCVFHALSCAGQIDNSKAL